MKYHHLTEGERYQIQALNAEGFGPSAIGQRIGRCKSVISRELRRHLQRGRYQAGEAQRSYRQRLQDKQQGDQVYKALRCQKARKKRYGKPERRGQIACPIHYACSCPIRY